jgi:hypothetical protein
VALITIDGVEIPAPTKYTVNIMDISKSERNAAGEMITERIATKRKIEMSWDILGQDDTSTLLNSVDPVFFYVEYIDPKTGGLRTGTFYSGDRSSPAITFSNGIMQYKDVKFNIIER